MKVVVIGGEGQLGSDCVEAFTEAGHEVASLGHSRLDIRDAESVQRVMRAERPWFVVNTAAMHNVDACEASPADAYAVNAVGARNLAASAADLGFRLAHVSTDYVFDGARAHPYSESDLPRPLNVYGNSKLAGEHYVLALGDMGAVIRTSGLYGVRPCRAKGGDNFVRLMLRLARDKGEVKVVEDEIATPTYTHDLARQIVTLAASDASGLFHATSQGQVSWYEFAKAIFDLSGVPCAVTPARSADFPKKTPRPSYSVLDNAALRSAGIDIMPGWEDSLRRYLRAM